MYCRCCCCCYFLHIFFFIASFIPRLPYIIIRFQVCVCVRAYKQDVWETVKVLIYVRYFEPVTRCSSRRITYIYIYFIYMQQHTKAGRQCTIKKKTERLRETVKCINRSGCWREKEKGKGEVECNSGSSSRSQNIQVNYTQYKYTHDKFEDTHGQHKHNEPEWDGHMNAMATHIKNTKRFVSLISHLSRRRCLQFMCYSWRCFCTEAQAQAQQSQSITRNEKKKKPKL